MFSKNKGGLFYGITKKFGRTDIEPRALGDG